MTEKDLEKCSPNRFGCFVLKPINKDKKMKNFKDMTDVEKQNHLKLKIGHGIECKSYREACLVCEQLDNLGMTWYDGQSYIRECMWEYNENGVFVYGPFAGFNVTGNGNETLPAVTWLANHGVNALEFGDKCWVSDNRFDNLIDGGKSKSYFEYLGGNMTLARANKLFKWNYIVPVGYVPWVDIEEAKPERKPLVGGLKYDEKESVKSAIICMESQIGYIKRQLRIER